MIEAIDQIRDVICVARALRSQVAERNVTMSTLTEAIIIVEVGEPRG